MISYRDQGVSVVGFKGSQNLMIERVMLGNTRRLILRERCLSSVQRDLKLGMSSGKTILFHAIRPHDDRSGVVEDIRWFSLAERWFLVETGVSILFQVSQPGDKTTAFSMMYL